MDPDLEERCHMETFVQQNLTTAAAWRKSTAHERCVHWALLDYFNAGVQKQSVSYVSLTHCSALLNDANVQRPVM